MLVVDIIDFLHRFHQGDRFIIILTLKEYFRFKMNQFIFSGSQQNPNHFVRNPCVQLEQITKEHPGSFILIFMAMHINEFAKFQYFLQIRKIVKFGSIQFDDYLFQDLTICYFPKSKSIFYSPKILLKYREIDEKVVNFL